MRDRSFQWRVNEGYHTIAAKYNIPRIDLVDKVSRHEKSIEEVHAEIMELIWLRELLPRREK